MKNELEAHEGLGCMLTDHDVSVALGSLRKPRRLDGYGVCLSLIRTLLAKRPGAITSVINNISCKKSFMELVEVHGHASGKKRSPVTPKAVRTILPLPCILAILDAHVSSQLANNVDLLADQIGRGFFEAARRGRQILDLTHPLTLVLEKGNDLHGQAAVAQADVKQYYDNLRPIHVLRWLRRNEVNLPLRMTFLRLHCLPLIRIAVGQSECSIRRRCSGVLTGTRSAAEAGRIPLLDIACRLHTWAPLSFSVPSLHCCLGTFVDNLFNEN